MRKCTPFQQFNITRRRGFRKKKRGAARPKARRSVGFGVVYSSFARSPRISLVRATNFVMASGFMLIVDTLARFSGIEIPLSILTGLIGTPFFVVLLAKQRGML